MHAQPAAIGGLGDGLQAGAVGLHEHVGDTDAVVGRLTGKVPPEGHRGQQPAVAQGGHGARGLATGQVQDEVEIAHGVVELLPGVVDRLVGAELGKGRVPGGAAVAIWTARCPIPPAAPMMSTHSPAWTSAVSTSACQAVSAAIGGAVASTSLRRLGVCASWREGAVRYWA